MINLYKQDGDTLYGIKEYIVDTESDIAKLPKNVKVGSTALVIENSALYILNGSKSWVLLGGSNSTGGGGSDDDSGFDNTLIEF